MRIRPFDNSESEYAAIAAVQNAAHPDQLLSAAGLQHTDQQRSAFFFFERYVAVSRLWRTVRLGIQSGLIGNTPHFLPEAWFIATDGDQYVGWCAVLDRKEPADMMRQGITVIDRAYRRRGLATVMKLKTFEFAQNLGKKWLETNNAEGNPMLDLNLALGFRPKFADLEYKRAWSNKRSLPHQVTP